MQTVQQQFALFKNSYPIENIGPLEELLFIDIETTGFVANSSQLYLIGCAFYETGNWYIRQYFANAPEDEAELITAFYQFAKRFKTLIHFNGNNFDIPYLNQKCLQLSLDFSFQHFNGFDIYKRIAPYKLFLKIPNCKQKTLEQYIGIDRKDLYNGGELINVYKEYQLRPTEAAFHNLMLHNLEDVKGMLMVTPILAFYDLFNKPLKVTKVQANHYKDYQGIERMELIMKLSLPESLPTSISSMANGFYFQGNGKEGVLKIPVYEEELKYFYANYKNYYYLPTEDMALHKSVAAYVDKNHRQQATAANCYTRKFSQYIPVWDHDFEPFFKRDYRSKEMFVELTQERKTDRDFFAKYASHILNILSYGI